MIKRTSVKIRTRILLCILAAILLTGFICCAVYLGDYYRADMDTISEFMRRGGAFWSELPDGTLVYKPDEIKAGLIFYPGGKVEHTAYLPLMKMCAAEGILCVIPEMPFRLAVLDINAANGIREMYPEVEAWYIGGHSLGGSMAASYVLAHAEEFAGLILLGSYSTEDLTNTSLAVLSIYGSEDGVLNREKYEENKVNLPASFEEIVIEGGCHAYFGMYGAQEGDGTPTLTAEEQMLFTAEKITDFIEKTS